ncbi:type II secretion system protein [Bacillus salipaludis]|uniref:Type II secretion system protein n=1 Tax=Bacillus salipaludis TaxID=2547811 RepID=A0AA90R9N5_9BACI|nr:type II secretion system protein [Bacillus salipaludis]MDQ6599826.1 type II secretion system protein [Bacillus salipaludis]
MFQKLRNKLKEQQGMTLIELLAVIVILGIIAAIAVPSILGLIDNTKKDAHVANAQQMINSAKMAISSDVNLQTGTKYLPLGYLEGQNFIEHIDDPDSTKTYALGTSQIESTITETDAISYVKIVSGQVTTVKLVDQTRGVQTSGGLGVAPSALKRGVVINNP